LQDYVSINSIIMPNRNMFYTLGVLDSRIKLLDSRQ